MLRKTITFTDYDGKEQKEVVYFNLNKSECVDIELMFEEDGGLIGHLKNLLLRQKDGETPRKETIEFVKLLVEKAYGVRPKENPSLFLKEDADGKPLFRRFKQSAAYDTFVFALISGEESLSDFITAVMPDLGNIQTEDKRKLLIEEGLGEFVDDKGNIVLPEEV